MIPRWLSTTPGLALALCVAASARAAAQPTEDADALPGFRLVAEDGAALERGRDLLERCLRTVPVLRERIDGVRSAGEGPIVVELGLGTEVVIGEAIDAERWRPALRLDVADLEALDAFWVLAGRSAWGGDACVAVAHEIEEHLTFTALWRGRAEEAGESAPAYQARMTELLDLSHVAGILMENRVRAARGAVDFRSTRCRFMEGEHEKVAVRVGRHTQLLTFRGADLHPDMGVAFLEHEDGCEARGMTPVW